MAQQTINIGSLANDGTGDTLRDAFDKVNDNFTEVYAVTSGALHLLEQHTASSSATLDFTSWYSATYDEYVIEFVGIAAATNSVHPYVRFSTNGGSSYDSSSIYDFAGHIANTGTFAANVNAGAGAAQGKIFDGMSNSAGTSMNGKANLYNPGSTSLYKMLVYQFGIPSGTTELYNVVGSGRYRSTTAVNAFRFYFSSGNIASGTIRVYGVVK
jgi:hypothetical protein